jgi:hypothetical protein
MNSGITTELTSSSNCIIPYWYGQGWACGINGTVVRSTRTTNQWLNVSGNGISSNVTLDNICGLDSNIAFVAGHLNANTWVWKTTNGGVNWDSTGLYLPQAGSEAGWNNAMWMTSIMSVGIPAILYRNMKKQQSRKSRRRAEKYAEI